MRQATNPAIEDQRDVWPVWLGYAIAVAAEAATTALLDSVQISVPGVNLRTPYVLLVGAVAYYFGAGPAIVALVTGFLGWLLFLLPPVPIGWPLSFDRGWTMAYSLLLTSGIAAVAMLRFRESSLRVRHLAAELQNALDREKHFSLLLQRALLPGDPYIDDRTPVAVGYVPLFSSREIGGDFYDIFVRRQGQAVIMVGDVSGKGLEAASLAATTRATIHAFTHETSSSAEVITRTNAALCSRTLPSDSFVTALVVVLDLSSGQFNYSNAGHPPAAICKADGSITFLEVSSQVPMCVIDSEGFSEFGGQLEPGDKLVLYTDGISEARRSGELFDVEGIARALNGASQLSTREVVDKVIAEATDWADNGLTDDALVAVVERGVKDFSVVNDDL